MVHYPLEHTAYLLTQYETATEDACKVFSEQWGMLGWLQPSFWIQPSVLHVLRLYYKVVNKFCSKLHHSPIGQLCLDLSTFMSSAHQTIWNQITIESLSFINSPFYNVIFSLTGLWPCRQMGQEVPHYCSNSSLYHPWRWLISAHLSENSFKKWRKSCSHIMIGNDTECIRRPHCMEDWTLRKSWILNVEKNDVGKFSV
jgi:hypothetical protein